MAESPISSPEAPLSRGAVERSETERLLLQRPLIFCYLLFFSFRLFGLLLPTQFLDALFLALDAGPGPREALVLLAPAGQRVERKRQPEQVQQDVQQTRKRYQRVQRTNERHDEASFQKKQAVLAAVLGEIFGLDGLTALVAPDPWIFHDRIAVKDQHQATGELESKKHLRRSSLYSGVMESEACSVVVVLAQQRLHEGQEVQRCKVVAGSLGG